MKQKKTSKNEKIKEKVVVTKTPAKPKTDTLVSRIRAVMEKGIKDKKECAEKVLVECNKEGITTNRKGQPITLAKVLTHINNIERDIKVGRKGWWSTLEVEKTDDLVKWNPKA